MSFWWYDLILWMLSWCVGKYDNFRNSFCFSWTFWSWSVLFVRFLIILFRFKCSRWFKSESRYVLKILNGQGPGQLNILMSSQLVGSSHFVLCQCHFLILFLVSFCFYLYFLINSVYVEGWHIGWSQVFPMYVCTVCLSDCLSSCCIGEVTFLTFSSGQNLLRLSWPLGNRCRDILIFRLKSGYPWSVCGKFSFHVVLGNKFYFACF